ncbi:MAG: DUF6845 domain-containing protein [Niabella sp.]
MKILNFLFSSVICVFLISGCNFSSEKGDEGKTSNVTISDQQEANDIIKFNNDFIKLSQNNDRYVNGVATYIENTDRFIQNLGKSIVNITPIAPIHVEISMYRSKKIPDGFGKEKKTMEDAYSQYLQNYDSLKAQMEILTNYIQAEDFKDDGGAKLKQIMANSSKLIMTHNQKREEIYTILEPVADAAEARMLKDHPLKDQIMSSKKLLDNIDNLLGVIDGLYATKTFDEAALQISYSAIEESLNNNKKLKIEDSKYKRNANSLEEYNKEVDSFLGAVRKLMRDGKAANTITEDDVNTISREYDSVVSAYNRFVD